MAAVGSEHLWRQMGQTSQANAYGILLRKLIRTLGVAATRANARMRLRVLGTFFGRRDDSQYHRTDREEARLREAECDNYNRHGPHERLSESSEAALDDGPLTGGVEEGDTRNRRRLFFFFFSPQD